MIEKIGKITNPLTIIAIFSGLAEVSGTLVLPFVDASNQAFFIYFLVLFPTLIVVLFFLTLNFNNKVLYAPSDYENEDNFVSLFRISQSVEEKQKRAIPGSEEAKNLFDIKRSLLLTQAIGVLSHYSATDLHTIIEKLNQLLLESPADQQAAILLGRLYRKDGNLDQAISILDACKSARRKAEIPIGIGDADIYFNIACYHCLKYENSMQESELDQCIDNLSQSIGIEPGNKEDAKNDPDFKCIHNNPQFLNATSS